MALKHAVGIRSSSTRSQDGTTGNLMMMIVRCERSSSAAMIKEMVTSAKASRQTLEMMVRKLLLNRIKSNAAQRALAQAITWGTEREGPQHDDIQQHARQDALWVAKDFPNSKVIEGSVGRERRSGTHLVMGEGDDAAPEKQVTPQAQEAPQPQGGGAWG
jgi:hypothetical protein